VLTSAQLALNQQNLGYTEFNQFLTGQVAVRYLNTCNNWNVMKKIDLSNRAIEKICFDIVKGLTLGTNTQKLRLR